jgi:sugar O-acyltransferase (sialic acid O-acetyltransferase NeuD family)
VKRLVIVGAGGFGREVLQWANDINNVKKKWNSVVFVDDEVRDLKELSIENEVVSSIEEYNCNQNDEIICAIGNPDIKVEIYKKFVNMGCNIATLKHPSSTIGDSVVLGKGVIICPNVVITTNVVIEDYVAINCNTTIGHDVSIGIGSTLSSQCDLMGYVKIGNCVFIGSGARIIPNVEVGDNSIIGAGSVVIRRIKKDSKVFGNPANEIY